MERISPLRILAVATVFGIFSALQAYNYVKLFTDDERPFYVLLALNVTYWYAWAVLVPGILWMARRYRIERHTWKRVAAMHCLGVLAFTLAHSVMWVTMRVWLMQTLAARELDWWMAFRELFFLNFDWEMMTYWAVIGLSHALDFHRESRERELTSAQLQAQLAEAQLQSLQRQLHPHFLFNTLHTISALMHRDTDAAEEMLARLSDLLRLTFEHMGTQTVALTDELEFLHKYLDIERVRFGDRLDLHVEVAPDTLDASVPYLLLQPLVENALRHGIAPKVGGGRVEVTVKREGDTLQVVVQDNGVGLSDEKLAALQAGVGIGNTRSRLERLYGNRHRFELYRPAGGGLGVAISIPFLEADAERTATAMESVA
jgi:signal transduction histidine kinase